MVETRVQPLSPGDLGDAQRAYMAPFIDAKGRYPNIFGVLARHMPLLDAWNSFGIYTMRGSLVDPVLREFLILRTSRNVGCDYEWHHHCRIATALGVTVEQLARVESGETLGDDNHDLMIVCADDLARDHRLSDTAWAAMMDRFGLQYTLDAIFTVGAYTALAMALNSCGVQIERRASGS